MTTKNPELEVFNPFDDAHVGSVKINRILKFDNLIINCVL